MNFVTANLENFMHISLDQINYLYHCFDVIILDMETLKYLGFDWDFLPEKVDLLKTKIINLRVVRLLIILNYFNFIHLD